MEIGWFWFENKFSISLSKIAKFIIVNYCKQTIN